LPRRPRFQGGIIISWIFWTHLHPLNSDSRARHNILYLPFASIIAAKIHSRPVSRFSLSYYVDTARMRDL
jgi:hypothetical protein